jgi:hypothetical protein
MESIGVKEDEKITLKYQMGQLKAIQFSPSPRTYPEVLSEYFMYCMFHLTGRVLGGCGRLYHRTFT